MVVMELGMDVYGELEGKGKVVVVMVQEMMKYHTEYLLFVVSDPGPVPFISQWYYRGYLVVICIYYFCN